jgi:hypothetical protein
MAVSICPPAASLNESVYESVTESAGESPTITASPLPPSGVLAASRQHRALSAGLPTAFAGMSVGGDASDGKPRSRGDHAAPLRRGDMEGLFCGSHQPAWIRIAAKREGGAGCMMTAEAHDDRERLRPRRPPTPWL